MSTHGAASATTATAASARRSTGRRAPAGGLRLYSTLNEDGTCSDTPLEVNTGKSYVAVTDVDFAENFVHSTLDGVNLSTATTQTYEKSYVEDDAKAGETLGSSTDDLTAAATGSGEAETTEAPAQETVTEETPAQEETPAEEAPAEETPAETTDAPADERPPRNN